ncbi:aminotransferase class I/II-fold pyridoxal phosphate-dependent enzyme [Anaerobutyricum hallii]|uniref:alanine transaminase n=1 Tax=Anaerobutyricum hallii TaxID=39488 RepID=A0A414B386_9FIRM|nr:aminotransferase class I/II-fold pyridoxal phosphate-dependent enzyme [Anaerobutyricum hallii]RHC62012.1 aminotransferase class I/II-fold pyridoxal phosphate-dependent enzyme [Anaerobutyricum hallii]
MIQKEVFSERLKAAMKKQNLKQIDLVRAAQVQGIKLGKSHVSQYVSGKTVPRTDILLFLAKTLQVEEEWLIGVSNVESDTEISATNRNILDTNKTILGNSNKENSEALTMSAKRQESSIFETEIISDVNKNIQTTSAATISRNISNKEGKKMRKFKKSSKLDNVLYDVRGPVVDEATRMEEAGTHVLKLNIGNPAPFGFRTPDEVIYDMRQQLTDCEGYSNAMGLFSARKAIMQYAQLKHIPNVNINDIYTGNGVSELINLCMSALLDNGDEILIPSPDYPLWTACATLAGGKPVHYICDEESEWYPDIDDIRKKINDRTKAIVIINPNNPTGALYPKEVLEQIVQVAREHQLIIFSDEIYDRLVMDGEKHISIASLASDLFCVTFSGLSKSHMIAGFRVGWMILSGNKAVAKDYIEGLNMLSNMRLCSNVPGQSIVQTALGGHQSVEDYIMPGGRIYEQREFIYKALTDIPGISAVKPKAAFYIFPKIDTKKFNIVNDEQFVLDLLREKKVLLIHGGGFNWQQPDHFRVVYLPRIEVLKKATDSMADFLNHYHQ